MLLCEPLSITFLGQLLKLQAGHIVHSLLGTQAIQPFHTSLPDFFKTESHSGKFFIDPPHHHLLILTDCLAAMMVHPTEDIFYVGAHLYACKNWCYHFYQSFVEGREDAVIDVVTHHLEDWASSPFQFWVNTLILKGWWNPLDQLASLLARLKVCVMCVACGMPTPPDSHLASNFQNFQQIFYRFLKILRQIQRFVKLHIEIIILMMHLDTINSSRYVPFIYNQKCEYWLPYHSIQQVSNLIFQTWRFACNIKIPTSLDCEWSKGTCKIYFI